LINNLYTWCSGLPLLNFKELEMTHMPLTYPEPTVYLGSLTTNAYDSGIGEGFVVELARGRIISG
jgi:hypothetical protein